MKERYEAPEVEVIKFGSADVLSDSDPHYGGEVDPIDQIIKPE